MSFVQLIVAHGANLMSCANDRMPFLQYVLVQEANVMSCESESYALHSVRGHVGREPCALQYRFLCPSIRKS